MRALLLKPTCQTHAVVEGQQWRKNQCTPVWDQGYTAREAQ